MLLPSAFAFTSAAFGGILFVFDSCSRCAFRDGVASARWRQSVELEDSVILLPGLSLIPVL